MFATKGLRIDGQGPALRPNESFHEPSAHGDPKKKKKFASKISAERFRFFVERGGKQKQGFISFSCESNKKSFLGDIGFWTIFRQSC
jgi:hypothetical protein